MSIPDYYKVLGVSPTAAQKEIRDAYKKAALKTHPDRVSTTDPTRPARTRKFQEVNDAYYTLSDQQRRRDYDEARRLSGASSSSSSFFGGSRPPPFPQHASEEWKQEQFGNAFEEMFQEEGVGADEVPGNGGGKIYGIVGGISGAALGFIVGSVPGMFAGAVAGNRLGAIRDAKGKSVYEVFQQLPQSDKAKISQARSYHMLLALSFSPSGSEIAWVALGVAVVWAVLNPKGRGGWLGGLLMRRLAGRK